MRITSLFRGALLMLMACGWALAADATTPSMTITSTRWHEGKPIPNECAFNGFGLQGGNKSPDLAWSGAPAGTKSFALTVFDPDAPTGVGFWHWVCFNIPAETTALPLDAGNAATKTPWVNGYTDYGSSGYGGPCPPPGDPPHHYVLTIYALDVPKLDMGPNITAALLKFSIRGHVLAQGTLTATYAR